MFDKTEFFTTILIKSININIKYILDIQAYSPIHQY